MNPIGIAFGPGVADIRSRASQRIERGGEKGGERGRIYFSRISINKGISPSIRGEKKNEHGENVTTNYSTLKFWKLKISWK